MRYQLELRYDGTDFCGFQIQLDLPTVQGTLEAMLTQLNKNSPIGIVGCGRTDTGVHAHYYVAHFEASINETLEDMKWKLNKMLPHSVSIISISEVHEKFHARFNAKERTYRYFIHTQKNPFLHRTSYLFHPKLDLEKMNQAAEYLLGEQDFTSFSKLHTQVKTNICTVTEAFWIGQNGQLIFQISANRFLRNMVRSIVGTLLLVGEGKISPETVVEIIAQKNRDVAGTSAPARGLSLWNIVY
jgi:tRNA pseudouridine38-40 synthase